MTYVEQCEYDAFNWNAFLNKPKFTGRELKDAESLANNWVTCACGNQCATLPRGPSGCPDDDTLVEQGHNFADCIKQMSKALNGNTHVNLKLLEAQRQRAKETLALIEERAAKLLKVQS